MSAYDFDTLLKKWEREELSTEQIIGQILLVLQDFSKRLGRLEKIQEKNRRQKKHSVD